MISRPFNPSRWRPGGAPILLRAQTEKEGEEMEPKKVTIQDLQAKKQRGEKIVRLVCYDFPMAVLADRAGVDAILVGDSLAKIVLGMENSLPLTMEEMIHHCKAVTRGVKYAMVIGDLPFLSYQTSVEEAIFNAGRLIKEGGVDGVKLEGGLKYAPTVRAIVDAGIPVVGHIGLTPQRRDLSPVRAKNLIDDALALEEAGAFMISLVCVPDRLAKVICERLSIPATGFGSGPFTDGQSFLLYDLIGLSDRPTPQFIKRYANTGEMIRKALKRLIKEVHEGSFPGPEHSFPIADEELQKALGD